MSARRVTLTLEVDEFDLARLLRELATARDEREGITVRTGGASFPVGLIEVSGGGAS